MIFANKRIKRALIRLREGTGWSVTLLFPNPEVRFSHVEANIKLKKIQYFLSKHGLDAQKKCLTEMFLLSTQNVS